MTIDSLAVGYLAIAAAVLIYSVLMTVQAYEFRRYALSRLRNPLGNPLGGRAAVIVACRGLDAGLSGNLRSLFEQDYSPYTLLLVVDHRDDPAVAAIEELIGQHPTRDARLIVAGAAWGCGQKVHNLLAAVAALPDDVEYLAFADSDTRTSRAWLGQLLQHLDVPGVAASTAYRWLIPARATLPNLLLHSLDAAVATVIGPARHHFVWGGSWAIRRRTFERYRLAAAWRGKLSDDLVAAQALRYAGRIRFEPEALAPTLIDYTWSDLLSFVHRQFALGRRYARLFWGGATICAVAHQGVFWTGLALAPLAVRGWTLWAAVASIVLYALQFTRAQLRQDAARNLLPGYSTRLREARDFDFWLAPLAGLVACWGLVSALGSVRIRWRGIHYRVSSDGQVQIVESTLLSAKADRTGKCAAARTSRAATLGRYDRAFDRQGSAGRFPLDRADSPRQPIEPERPLIERARRRPMHIVLWDTRRGGATKDFAGGFGVGQYPAAGGWYDRLVQWGISRDRRPVALAYAYLAAIFRRRGHTVEYAVDRFPQRADVYCFLPSLPTLPWERQAIARVNAELAGCRVLVGGLTAQTLPQAFEGLEATLIRGEIEQLNWKLGDVLASADRTVDVGLVADLDELPTPDWSLFSPGSFRVSYDFWRFPTALVQASRGCTLSCDYCPYIVLEKKTRFRQPEAVVAEMALAMRRHGFRSFKFRDPLFGLDRRRTLELAERIGRLPGKIQFSIESRIDLLREETLRALTCSRVDERDVRQRNARRDQAARARPGPDRGRRTASLHRSVPRAGHPHGGWFHDRLCRRYPPADRRGFALGSIVESDVRQFQRRHSLPGHRVFRADQASDRPIRLFTLQRLYAGADLPAPDRRRIEGLARPGVCQVLFPLAVARFQRPTALARSALARREPGPWSHVT